MTNNEYEKMKETLKSEHKKRVNEGKILTEEEANKKIEEVLERQEKEYPLPE